MSRIIVPTQGGDKKGDLQIPLVAVAAMSKSILNAIAEAVVERLKENEQSTDCQVNAETSSKASE